MAGLLDLIAERQKTLSAARPNSIAGLLAESGVRPGENLASMAQQYISTLPQKTQANLAYQMSLLNKAYPGDTYQSMMTQGDPKALAELAMQAPYNAMIAYHGTPHNILGKFDISKVGTGEGAQAYGHGMYFAENPEVAQTYVTATNPAARSAYMHLQANNGNIGETIKEAARDVKRMEENQQFLVKGALEQAKEKLSFLQAQKSGKPIETGNLYKVDIPDEYIPNMLDWDKPIGQQSKELQKAIEKTKKFVTQQDLDNLGGDLSLLYNKDMDVNRFLNTWSDLRGKPNAGEELLNQVGVKGIRYLDAGSRGKEGTSNFVVFDPSEVKILEKNSKKVEGLLSE